MHTIVNASRTTAINTAMDYFKSGKLHSILQRRISLQTESQNPESATILREYLEHEIRPTLERMDFKCKILENPVRGKPPLLFAERIESPSLLTLLTYAHGDVTAGQEGKWHNGVSPWTLTAEEDRLYGRGTADNKGQHTINLTAIEAVWRTRNKRLGFNIKIIFEMAEEIGSPGLELTCKQNADLLSADLFLASDGPRVRHDIPTIFLGSRGVCQFRLSLDTKNGSRHSGNWGGIITNPAIVLCNALSTIVSGSGQLLLEFLKPPALTSEISTLIRDLPVGGQDFDPLLNPNWGEPSLTAGEQLYGYNTLEIVGIHAGDTINVIGAVPGKAEIVCQLRFVPGTDWKNLIDNLRTHLDEQGFNEVTVVLEGGYAATRLDIDHPWVNFVSDSVSKSLNLPVCILPNLGGTIPNHCFSDVLQLPTVWLPHSYPSCKQHAPDEHVLLDIVEQGLKAATGVFWDLGETDKQPKINSIKKPI
ncbi:M20 family metallopeptidase [Pseudomonas sp. S37]|uniref:M20 family metallopeptidase n=1 Tax=Pseudomonas sp. S37 TaxID=2767449 RepID=UPI001912EB27|nr:M20 family metallopeptidase [Pseudomonas sp. S37]MBK4992444.1 M20 family metallopeptidase [Pseudomonas sp. S37]